MKNKYLLLSILTIGLMACGESESTNENESSEHITTNEQTDVISEIDTVLVEEVTEAKVDFSKFEHYATILTKDDLIAEFGKENLEDKTSWYAEGTVERQSSILTNPKNGNIVKYVWAEEDNSTTSWIEANYYKWDENFEIHGTQTIETENGLKLGMSLAELRVWNEADFRFSGFGWDYAGGVFAEEGSKLYDSKTQVTLINDQNASNEGFDFIIGDVELNADAENLKDAPILVEQFTIHIQTNGGE